MKFRVTFADGRQIEVSTEASHTALEAAYPSVDIQPMPQPVEAVLEALLDAKPKAKVKAAK